MATAALAQLALLLCLLAVAGLVAGIGVICSPLAARARGRRRAAEPRTTRRPIQVVAADLRRLARQLAPVPSGPAMVRRQALLAAYDEVLVEVAEQLEVPTRLAALPHGPSRAVERQRLLAALEDAGLAVHA